MKPLEEAELAPITEVQIAYTMKIGKVTREAAIASLEAEALRTTYWMNDVYQVAKHVGPDGRMAQLNIRRRDGRPIFRDWRHFQAIKNQLCGPECEGVELYPAESRLVDTSNKYHIWVVLDPTYRFPIGWPDRDVQYSSANAAGFRQRRAGAS